MSSLYGRKALRTSSSRAWRAIRSTSPPSNAVRRSGEWRTIYLRKKAQGKTAKQALIVVAVRLLHPLYAMLKHRQPYNPSRLLVAAATIGS